MFYSYLYYTIRTLIVQVKPPNSRRKSRVCGGNSSNGKILIQSRDYFALSEKCKQRYRCHVCIWKSWAFSKRCSRVFKIKNQKNRRNAVKSTFLPLLINAADRNRTGTGITTHGILSPGRLPVPPLRHIYFRTYCADIRACTVLLSYSYIMDGGGFEPPKQFAADLQSVPFGHSGIPP